jgi:hypothetical protein
MSLHEIGFYVACLSLYGEKSARVIGIYMEPRRKVKQKF